MERGEPVNPAQEPQARRAQRWRSGHAAHWQVAYVTVGTLPDGRWFAERTKVGAWAYPTEHDARNAAAQLMQDRDDWQECPAEYDANGHPAGSGWVRRGGDWVRG